MDRAAVERAAGWIGGARSVAVVTGAGVSAESRIPTFRDTMEALWKEFDPATLATPEAFEADPETVTRWYDWRRLRCLEAEPNPGHVALADLQRKIALGGGVLTIATQNVDGLHQRAGSTGVLELHGSIMAWRGARTGRPAVLPARAFADYPPTLEDGEPIRPGVVWFGEALPGDVLEAAAVAAAECDVFLSIGTSSVVYPAAGLIELAKRRGARTIEVNPQATAISGEVDLVLTGPSGQVLPAVLDAMDAG